MRKSFSTLIATTFQHSSSCRGSHSLTETVYFASLSFFGLVSSFHNISPTLLLAIIFFVFFKSFPIITQSQDFRQAILRSFPLSFFFFLFFFVKLYLVAHTHRHYKILETLVFHVFNGKGGIGHIEGNDNFFFAERFHGVKEIFAVHGNF